MDRGAGTTTRGTLDPPRASHSHRSPASKLVVVTRAVADGTSPRWVAYIEEDGNFLLGEKYIDPVKTRWQDLIVICLDCLLEEHPCAGRGMDLARKGGVACSSEGEWRIEDEDDAA
jgi:hypothetical protein